MGLGDRPIRWGVVATGGIAQTVTSDLARLEDAQLAAVSSRAGERAQAFADRYGFARAHAGIRDLLADEEVDVVYVATPHAQHHQVASRLLAAGKAVLCEKAFTMTRAEAQDLRARARDRGVFCMEAMWTRFNPLVVRMRELIAAGAIGDVRSVTADLGSPVAWEPSSRMWDATLGGGALLDGGVYPISFAQMLLGEPQRVAAHGSLADNGVDREAGVLLGFDGGAHAVLSCSFAAYPACAATVAGTKGRLVLDPPFQHPTRMTLTRGDGDPEVIEQPLEGGGYLPMLREVQRCLRAGEIESPTMPLDDSVAVMGILDRALADVGVRYPAPAPIV